MDQDSAHMVAALKVPMLKPEKAELKARSTLLMGIPNEHQLKFNSIKDAKSLLQAVEKSQLEIHGETISQEDVNQKFLRSLSPEWNTHIIVKGTSSTSTQNVPLYPQITTAAQMEQLILLMVAMLTMRAMRFLKKTKRKFSVNGNETIGFDKSKVECYECHKMGHFARECRALRNQENKNRDNTRRVVPVEVHLSSNAVVLCDGARMVMIRVIKQKKVQNFALMAYNFYMFYSEISTNSHWFIISSYVKKPEVETFIQALRILEKNNGAPIIEECVSDSKDEAESKPKIEKKTIQVSDGLGPQKRQIFLPYVHGNPQQELLEKGVIDSGCSRHVTGNMSYLTNFEEIDRGYVAFGGNPKRGKITGRGTIKTGNLDFKEVYFVRELKCNLFSVSQMCDKKNSVLFNDT
ncbi:ribonuclease H-like domain-containing protein [Tanacetum coccineum]